jgi:hypothetical protein
MKVDEYAIGVFAYLLLLGDGTNYPVQLGDKNYTDEKICQKIKGELSKSVIKQIETLPESENLDYKSPIVKMIIGLLDQDAAVRWSCAKALKSEAFKGIFD